MIRRMKRLLWVAMVGMFCCGAALAGEAEWAQKAREVHTRFTGEQGTLAHFGDSITATLAFWTPLLYERRDAPTEMEEAFERVKAYMRPECWREWKGSQFGNESDQTVRWADRHVGEWLERLNPEVAVILFGTNDLTSVPLDEYEAKMRLVVSRCHANGTVAILTTIPPRHGMVEKAAEYAQTVRRIAGDMEIPLIDFHAEMLRRRPEDWNGADPKFSDYHGYDVPTLIARDGVHPSNPKSFQDDYSPRGLAHSGYMLRSYLTLMKYAEVIGDLNRPEGEAETLLAVEPLSVTELAFQDWLPKAPALPEPKGAVVEVGTPEELIHAIETASEGATILLEDGVYMMPRYVAIETDRVTLRSRSGDRRSVVIDGSQSRDGELIGFTACRGVTVADLTIQNIRWNGFKINSETGVHDLTIYNCIIHNIWQRGVKGVKVPLKNRRRLRPRNCRVQYCLFYNDRPKRFSDDPADRPDNFNGDYIGGIDIMYASGWTISDNVFVGIQGRTRQGRGAVFLWHGTRDTIVERNIIIDCDAGVCLGNPHRPSDIRIHCTDCTVRNNFVARAPQGGLVPVYTRDCELLHNTIYEPESRLGRLIRVVFENEGLVIANNLLCGPDIRMESESEIKAVSNVARDVSGHLADPACGDLHLTGPIPGVTAAADRLPGVTQDIDGQERPARADIGADEVDP